MKKSLLLVSLFALSLSLVGCNLNNNSTSNSSNNETNQTSGDSSYTKISDVSKLFATYSKQKDYNFEAKYQCSTVYKRQFVSSIKTDYQYCDGITQLTYEMDGSFYTDYYFEDASKDIYTYYIDMGGTKEYQLIDGQNEYFHQYHNAIDTIDIANIDWEENFKVNEEEKKIIPVNEEAMNEVGSHIFGEKVNEFWEKLDISYDNGYITKIEAISIYMETVYYFTITLSNHTWVSIDLPTATKDYVGNQPVFYNEEYKGVALTEEQKAAIEFLDNPKDANYTVSTNWEQYQLGAFTGASLTTSSAYADGNAYYRYTNASDGITHSDYLIATNNGQYVYYADDGAGSYSQYISGTDEYSQVITNYALDQLNLANLDSSKFIYNAEKDYIMPKDKETEKALVNSIFGYKDYYFGVHIYLNANKTAISKIETSLFIEQGTSVASYKKVYTITEIGTTVLNYPKGVTLL